MLRLMYVIIVIEQLADDLKLICIDHLDVLDLFLLLIDLGHYLKVA